MSVESEGGIYASRNWRLRIRVCTVCFGLLLTGCICVFLNTESQERSELSTLQASSQRSFLLPPWIKCDGKAGSGCVIEQVDHVFAMLLDVTIEALSDIAIRVQMKVNQTLSMIKTMKMIP